jgi:hypothetical protein
MVSKKDIEEAKAANPQSFLMSQGFDVWREGPYRLIAAKDDIKAFRIDYKPNQGIWLYCDIYGNHGDDMIGLAKEVLNVRFHEAVAILKRHPGGSLDISGRKRQTHSTGHRSQNQNFKSDILEPIPIKLPLRGDFSLTMSYLCSRGILEETVTYADEAGFIYPVDDGLLFIGYDDIGKVMSATWRSTFQGANPSKRDLRGSDKRYTPILPGNSKEVWIVEGGVDALATHTFARLNDKEPPTAIVSGGASASRFLKNGYIPGKIYWILRGASRVVVTMESEKNAIVQARTDEGHRNQANLAGLIAEKAQVVLWHPPQGQGKDIADVLAFQRGF